MKKIFLFLFLAVLLYGCEKNEYPTYAEKDGLSFTKGGDLITADSIVYSFITNAIQGDRDTIWIPISLMGSPAQVDQAFQLRIGAGSTAKEGVHFELTESIFPANEVTFEYPVVLLRSEDLMEETRKINLEIIENDFYTVGVLSREFFESVRIDITDQVIKPSWWGFAEDYYYGSYSHGKFRFMIEVCGISDFSSTMLSFPQILNYRELVSAALKEYEKEHGEPLRDENNQAITI